MTFAPFPFIRYLLFFVLGVLYYTHWPYFFGFLYILFGLIILFFSGLTILKEHKLQGLILAITFFLFGWLIAYQKTVINYKNHFLNQGHITYYQAVVSSNVEIKPKTYKVEAQIQQIKINNAWVKSDGSVLLYFNKNDSKKPRYGDMFLLKGSPRSVEAPKNPKEFDYRLFLQRKGIYAHAFIYPNDVIKIGYRPPNAIMSFAIGLNTYADSLFKANIPNKDNYAIINAMVVGLRDDVDNDLLKAYSAVGAIHVLSVSGMHVAILYVILGFIFGGIKKLKHGKIIFNILIISSLWAYAVFTGLSSTVLRATFTFTFIQLAELINRRSSIYNALAISAFCLLCYNPFWIYDVGFQLSYLAIIGIAYLHPIVEQWINPPNNIVRKIWEISSIAFAAQLATLPLSIYYFHQFPTYFLLANPFVFVFSEGILPLGLALLIFGWIPICAKIISFWLNISLYLLNKSVFLLKNCHLPR